jgi:N-acetylmuramoyl-L-alanine amidase
MAIVVGHDHINQGAINYLGETEYKFNSRIARYLERGLLTKEGHLGLEVRIFYKDGTTERDVAKDIADWGASYALELHFNSFRGKARGCEILIDRHVPHFNHAFRSADKLSDRLSRIFKVFQRRIDGVFVIDSGDRGHRSLHEMSKQGVTGFIVEPCFANKKTRESQAIFNNEQLYAAQLCFWIIDTLREVKDGKAQEKARTKEKSWA